MSGKLRLKRVVTHKLDFDASTKVLHDRQEAFIKAMDARMLEMTTKHNNMAASLIGMEQMAQNVIKAVAVNMGTVNAKLEQLSTECDKSLSGLDRNVLALAELSKEIYWQFQQIDFFLHKLADQSQVALEMDEDDTLTARAMATAWHQEMINSAFSKVQQRFVELEQERMKQATEEQMAKEMAEKAAKDKDESDRVGEEFNRAENSDRSTIASAGGPGADIPADADIFGG